MTEVVSPGIWVVVGSAGLQPCLHEVTVMVLVVRLVVVWVPLVIVTRQVVTVVYVVAVSVWFFGG